MDTSITHLDAMILYGYRGGAPHDRCRLAPGVSPMTLAHEKDLNHDHPRFATWRETVHWNVEIQQ